MQEKLEWLGEGLEMAVSILLSLGIVAGIIQQVDKQEKSDGAQNAQFGPSRQLH